MPAMETRADAPKTKRRRETLAKVQGAGALRMTSICRTVSEAAVLIVNGSLRMNL